MTDRGQSPLDFLVGTVIFLLVLIAVIAFIPGMLDPFATGTEARPVTADRAVTSLAMDELSSPETPYITTEQRIETVFSQSETELSSSLGLSSRVGLNVTLVNRSGMVVVNRSETVARVGPPPPKTRSVTAAWRVISYRDRPANLTVRVW